MKSENTESGLCRMKSCFGLFYLEASVNQTYMSFILLTCLVYEMKNSKETKYCICMCELPPGHTPCIGEGEHD